MAERRDRTELREDLPEDVRHPNETTEPSRIPTNAIVAAAVAIMLILIAVAITVV